MPPTSPLTTLIPMQTDADRIAAIKACERVSELEVRIGRTMPPDSPILLAMLSSSPDAPLMSPLPSLDD